MLLHQLWNEGEFKSGLHFESYGQPTEMSPTLP